MKDKEAEITPEFVKIKYKSVKDIMKIKKVLLELFEEYERVKKNKMCRIDRA